MMVGCQVIPSSFKKTTFIEQVIHVLHNYEKENLTVQAQGAQMLNTINMWH